jgi:hypothetical protein
LKPPPTRRLRGATPHLSYSMTLARLLDTIKRDSTALIACTFDKKAQCVRLIAHRVFTPAPDDPINFEQTVEATLLDWRKRYFVRKVWFDPFQMVSVAQRLQKAHVPIEEFPQSIPNLTASTSNLFDLIQARTLVLYPDAGMRLAVSRAIVTESSRGWKIDKLKQSHHIDVIVALSMAALPPCAARASPRMICGVAFPVRKANLPLAINSIGTSLPRGFMPLAAVGAGRGSNETRGKQNHARHLARLGPGAALGRADRVREFIRAGRAVPASRWCCA